MVRFVDLQGQRHDLDAATLELHHRAAPEAAYPQGEVAMHPGALPGG